MMKDAPLHLLSDADIPNKLAKANLSCPFCNQVQSGRKWLRASFNCDCSDSANTLQTFRQNAEGTIESYRHPEFWALYQAAQEAHQRKHTPLNTQHPVGLMQYLESMLGRAVAMIASAFMVVSHPNRYAGA